MKKLCCVLVMTGLLATGCANIQNDATRTKTEGTLVGAGAGAGLGALIGGLIGGEKGALLGAGIGTAVGTATGYLVGNHIANKKEEYASREEWLDACISQAQQVNAETVAYNQKLKTEIASLDKQSTKLAAEYKRKKATREILLAEKKTVEQRRTEVAANLKRLEEEVDNQKTVLADAREGNNTQEAAIIEREIAKMEKQVAEMKAYNAKLASISARMAV